MNGKDYVLSAVEKADQIASDLKSSGKLGGDPLLEGLAKAWKEELNKLLIQKN